MRALSTPTTMRGHRQREQSSAGVTFGSVSGIARLIFGHPFVVPAGAVGRRESVRPRTRRRLGSGIRLSRRAVRSRGSAFRAAAVSGAHVLAFSRSAVTP